MNENTNKIIIVVAVIVIVVAAVGAFLVLNNNNGGSSKDIDASLEVYGNADGDYKIDSKDLDIINKIIAKESGYTLEKYPLADAYMDDVVDDKDVEQVKKIISGVKSGEQITVWHLNHTTDTTVPGGIYVVDTKWPITKAVANGAANSLVLYEMVGLGDNIVGINYSSGSPPDKIVYPKYAAMESLGSSTTSLTEDKLVDCLKKNPGTTAVITADNKSYLASGCNEKYIEETLKTDVIRIQHAAVDPKEHASAILMLGFLFQKDTKAEEVAEWTSETFKQIDKMTSSAKDKVRVAASSGEKYLSALNSDYADVVIQAGGEYTLWEQSSASIYFKEYKGSTKTYEPDPRVFLEEHQADKYIGIRTGAFLGSIKDGASWYGSPDKWDVAKMKAYVEDFSVFKAYADDGVTVISGDIPIVARVLYAACALYPDLVSKEFADEKHQEFVDKFLGGAYTVKDCHFMFTQEEIEKMKA